MVRTSFNSTTVQLIHYSDDALFASQLFQFHNGTINTEEGTKQSDITYSFNSTTVQLIPILTCHALAFCFVSIPQRYN